MYEVHNPYVEKKNQDEDEKFRPVQNTPAYEAAFGKRTSNASGVHADRRFKRNRTRAASKRTVMREYE